MCTASINLRIIFFIQQWKSESILKMNDAWCNTINFSIISNSGEQNLLFQVSLQTIRSRHNFCGGVIFNKNYVITAAHCMREYVFENKRWKKAFLDSVSTIRSLYSKDVSLLSAVVGTTDLRLPYAVYLLESYYVHEKYNRSDSWVNDIALIKVISILSVNSGCAIFIEIEKFVNYDTWNWTKENGKFVFSSERHLYLTIGSAPSSCRNKMNLLRPVRWRLYRDTADYG